MWKFTKELVFTFATAPGGIGSDLDSLAVVVVQRVGRSWEIYHVADVGH